MKWQSHQLPREQLQARLRRVESHRRLRDHTGERESQHTSRRLVSSSSLSGSLELFISVVGMCLVPALTSISTSQLIPISLQATVAFWFVAEQWFWLASILRREGHFQLTQSSIVRAGLALTLWLFISALEFSGSSLIFGGKLIFGLLWSESLFRSYRRRAVYALTPQQAREASESLIGTLALFSSLTTLLMWRSHQLKSPIELTSVIMIQAPLLITMSTHWLRFFRPHLDHQWITAFSYCRHCGLSALLTISTAFAYRSESLSRSAILVLSVAGVIFYYSSYLLPERHHWRKGTRLISSPLRSLAFSFLCLCAIGTGLLLLPHATLDGKGFSFMEAVFTSVSASCITGLSVIDLSKVSFFGQCVVLSLIQIGGFGIVLLSYMLLSSRSLSLTGLLGRRSSTGGRRVGFRQISALLGESDLSTSEMATRLMRYVFIVESLSALVLSWCFMREGLAPLDAIWRGFFTAISAFCNAGFALQSDSFISLSESPLILWVISFTVVFGGIGPTVVFNLIDKFKSRGAKVPLSYFSRLVLWGSLFLLVVPTVAICFIEWDLAFGHLSVVDKISNAFFHSTSLRTAGFNSIDLSSLSDSSWSISIMLMIVGGSPLSTAGGIKVTTLMIALSSTIPTLMGRSRSILFDRSQPRKQSAKSMATIILSLMTISLVTLMLQMAGESLEIKELLFEVVSALGTVGLSMGGTGSLSTFGLSLIMLCMFIGRVGPPVLLLSITEGAKAAELDTYLDEDIPLA